ncbi:hypothetical protein PGIGA_G00019790 [Pangasianodon gigas]|uniref:Uncharacterized protein n=1 Tax=Pangasianodon gigas TaxID=30993 RepID=A0ACC5WUR7_PANGG|nr:hypothetical protein [Pangasianodon gigas]
MEGTIQKGELITYNLTELVKPEAYQVRLTPITRFGEGDSIERIIRYSAYKYGYHELQFSTCVIAYRHGHLRLQLAACTFTGTFTITHLLITHIWTQAPLTTI